MTADADVGRFLALFTDMAMDEVERLSALEGAEINEAKKILATEATELAHGADAAKSAAKTAQATFEEGTTDQGLPTHLLDLEAPAQSYGVLQILVAAKLASSNSEARRLIKGGGARINDQLISDEKEIIAASDFPQEGIKVSAGKKRHALVKLKRS